MKALKYLLGISLSTLLIISCSDDAAEEVMNTGSEDVETNLPADYLTFNNNQYASVVIGQTGLGTYVDTEIPAANIVYDSQGKVGVLDGKLYIASYSRSLVHIFDSIPTEHNASASLVLGADDVNTTAIDSGVDVFSFNRPSSVASDGTRVVITDWDRDQVLIYNQAPTSPQTLPDVVVGQVSLSDTGSGCAVNKVRQPSDAMIVDGKLIIADEGNHRILIYNTVPTENNASADLVIGQPDFDTCTPPDQVTISSNNMSSPGSIWSDGTRFVVADTTQSRVLIWNEFPTENDQNASIVLGQKDFYGRTRNEGNDTQPTEYTLSIPTKVHGNSQQLFVCDMYNHRILVWNTFPTQTYQKADVVLGQEDFYSQENNVTKENLQFPNGVFQYGSQLFVADAGHNRVLIYNSLSQ